MTYEIVNKSNNMTFDNLSEYGFTVNRIKIIPKVKPLMWTKGPDEIRNNEDFWHIEKINENCFALFEHDTDVDKPRGSKSTSEEAKIYIEKLWNEHILSRIQIETKLIEN